MEEYLQSKKRVQIPTRQNLSFLNNTEQKGRCESNKKSGLKKNVNAPQEVNLYPLIKNFVVIYFFIAIFVNEITPFFMAL